MFEPKLVVCKEESVKVSDLQISVPQPSRCEETYEIPPYEGTEKIEDVRGPQGTEHRRGQGHGD